jgi:hypothetical protein
MDQHEALIHDEPSSWGAGKQAVEIFKEKRKTRRRGGTERMADDVWRRKASK